MMNHKLNWMRSRLMFAAVAFAALMPLAPGIAHAAGAGFACPDIPKAQDYVDHLGPGPNTRAAQRHLDAAKSATSDSQCVGELRQVDKYARRSAAADRRLAARPARARVVCADPMHQDRPGGTDYKGPPVAGCHTPKI